MDHLMTVEKEAGPAVYVTPGLPFP